EGGPVVEHHVGEVGHDLLDAGPDGGQVGAVLGLGEGIEVEVAGRVLGLVPVERDEVVPGVGRVGVHAGDGEPDRAPRCDLDGDLVPHRDAEVAGGVLVQEDAVAVEVGHGAGLQVDVDDGTGPGRVDRDDVALAPLEAEAVDAHAGDRLDAG